MVDKHIAGKHPFFLVERKIVANIVNVYYYIMLKGPRWLHGWSNLSGYQLGFCLVLPEVITESGAE